MTTPICVRLSEVIVASLKFAARMSLPGPSRGPRSRPDIGGLQVAMRDTFFMCRRQRIPQSTGDLERSVRGEARLHR
jgi:hypothetical protein